MFLRVTCTACVAGYLINNPRNNLYPYALNYFFVANSIQRRPGRHRVRTILTRISEQTTPGIVLLLFLLNIRLGVYACLMNCKTSASKRLCFITDERRKKIALYADRTNKGIFLRPQKGRVELNIHTPGLIVR